jgi:hypothetical protein
MPSVFVLHARPGSRALSRRAAEEGTLREESVECLAALR